MAAISLSRLMVSSCKSMGKVVQAEVKEFDLRAPEDRSRLVHAANASYRLIPYRSIQ